MKELISQTIEHLAKDHLENIIFYFISSVVMIVLLIRNDKEIKRGLKGDNDLLEASESVIYIWIWLLPQIILSVLFLRFEPQEWFWLFIGICLLFALAGRDGIQMLFNWRGKETKDKEI